MFGKPFQKGPKGGNTEVQGDSARRLRDAPCFGQAEGSLGNARRFGLGVGSQQILPSSPGFGGLVIGKLALPHAEAGVDDEVVAGIGLDEPGIVLCCDAGVAQFLAATSDEHLDFSPFLRPQADVQGGEVELEGLRVVGFCLVVFGREGSIGELEIDIGNLLFSIRAKQVLRLTAIDGRCRLEVSLACPGLGGVEAGPAPPRAFGEGCVKRTQNLRGLGIVSLKEQGSAFQVGEVIQGRSLPGHGCLDHPQRFNVVAVL